MISRNIKYELILSSLSHFCFKWLLLALAAHERTQCLLFADVVVSAVQMFLPPQRRSYQLFTPQCDADGRWLHTQCYHSTGHTHTHTHTHTLRIHMKICYSVFLQCSFVALCVCSGQCWCVDEDGEYIPDSLTSRSLHLPTCEKIHTHTF